MIRLARPDDATEISRIAAKAYHPYIERLGRPPAPMVADFSEHIDQDWVVVFEHEDSIFGYAVLIVDENRALLDNIAVDPARQRLGVGRTLIDRVQLHVAKLGRRQLELYTNIAMTENIGWYRKLGFTETKRVVEHGFHRVYMAKAIVPCL